MSWPSGMSLRSRATLESCASVRSSVSLGALAAKPGVRPPKRRDEESLVPVSYSAIGQVIRGELERYPVSVHDLDAVPSQPAGHGCQYGLPCLQLDGKHSGLELLNNLTGYFD